MNCVFSLKWGHISTRSCPRLIINVSITTGKPALDALDLQREEKLDYPLMKLLVSAKYITKVEGASNVYNV